MFFKKYFLGILICSVLLGCNSTPPAKDFSNNWSPVNKFTDKITEIPLHHKYTYRVMAIDKTLKSLLNRWDEDSKLSVEYGSCYDYTLPKAAEKINAVELNKALEELNRIYSAKHVVVSVRKGSLVVETVANAAGYIDTSCF